MTIIVLLFAAGVFAWATAVYNRPVRDRNCVIAGCSDVDVQLERRHDPIPRLVGAVRSGNPRIESFPDLRRARGVGFAPRKYFQSDSEAQAQAARVTVP